MDAGPAGVIVLSDDDDDEVQVVERPGVPGAFVEDEKKEERGESVGEDVKEEVKSELKDEDESGSKIVEHPTAADVKVRPSVLP